MDCYSMLLLIPKNLIFHLKTFDHIHQKLGGGGRILHSLLKMAHVMLNIKSQD